MNEVQDEELSLHPAVTFNIIRNKCEANQNEQNNLRDFLGMKFYFWIMKLRRIDFSGLQFKYDRIHYNFEQFEIMGNISTYSYSMN